MRLLTIVLATAALGLATAAVSYAEHHEQEAGEAGMPAMGPPEEMKQIESMNGEYAVQFFYKMDPTGSEWVETEATAVLSMVAGGAAQQMVFEGEMMGTPFSGVGLMSYDRETGMWQETWVDSMGARISMYTGTFEDGTIVVTGEDLGQGMKSQSRLTTYNITDKGFDWKYEMSMDGTNYMETAKATYTRK